MFTGKDDDDSIQSSLLDEPVLPPQTTQVKKMEQSNQVFSKTKESSESSNDDMIDELFAEEKSKANSSWQSKIGSP